LKFEKWQALGNDYLIVERGDLPFDLTPTRIRRLCEPHMGVGSDGILLLDKPTQRGYVASLRIFNPDGSEAELSGNGAREAIMYLRRSGWTESDTFSIETAAGEVRPTITGPETCRVAMTRARLVSKDYPGGNPDGTGLVTVAGQEFAFQHVSIGNPQCAIEVTEGLEDLNLQELGPPIESDPLFPNRTNVSFWRAEGDGEIRARIFERGVGETLSSGTGASGAAVAYVLKGGATPVTVHLDGGDLEVEVGDDLHVTLTGWAKRVYAATLSDEFIEELNETQ
jgi:diaminopimelate epimerase